jgi:hypothetical protein
MSKTGLPSANSPQLVTRLVEAVAGGVRSSRGLKERLALQVQTVRAYAQAAEWLGFLESEPHLQLTPLGLEYVYAGRQRAFVYARAVWSIPLAADLLVASDGRLPEMDAVVVAAQREEPDLAGATLHRKASALRSLIGPAVGRSRPRMRAQEELQLGLPLEHAAGSASSPRLGRVGNGEYDPDAYRYVLACLLDYGELTLTHLRGLLDRAGARDLPIGGFVDMAVSRGDAVRVGERLVATPDAIARRDLVAATPSIMLSDPLYRAYLADVVLAATDRRAEMRRDAAAGRFKQWDRRLFGRAIDVTTVVADLEHVVMDRPLSAYPVASTSRKAASPVEEAFLDVWERRGLCTPLPPPPPPPQG